MIEEKPNILNMLIQMLDKGYGDQRLWRAIISQAVKDLNASDKKVRMEAIEWFVRCGKDYRAVCKNANVLYWRLRQAIMKELKIV